MKKEVFEKRKLFVGFIFVILIVGIFGVFGVSGAGSDVPSDDEAKVKTTLTSYPLDLNKVIDYANNNLNFRTAWDNLDPKQREFVVKSASSDQKILIWRGITPKGQQIIIGDGISPYYSSQLKLWDELSKSSPNDLTEILKKMNAQEKQDFFNTALLPSALKDPKYNGAKDFLGSLLQEKYGKTIEVGELRQSNIKLKVLGDSQKGFEYSLQLMGNDNKPVSEFVLSKYVKSIAVEEDAFYNEIVAKISPNDNTQTIRIVNGYKVDGDLKVYSWDKDGKEIYTNKQVGFGKDNGEVIIDKQGGNLQITLISESSKDFSQGISLFNEDSNNKYFVQSKDGSNIVMNFDNTGKLLSTDGKGRYINPSKNYNSQDKTTHTISSSFEFSGKTYFLNDPNYDPSLDKAGVGALVRLGSLNPDAAKAGVGSGIILGKDNTLVVSGQKDNPVVIRDYLGLSEHKVYAYGPVDYYQKNGQLWTHQTGIITDTSGKEVSSSVYTWKQGGTESTTASDKGTQRVTQGTDLNTAVATTSQPIQNPISQQAQQATQDVCNSQGGCGSCSQSGSCGGEYNGYSEQSTRRGIFRGFFRRR